MQGNLKSVLMNLPDRFRQLLLQQRLTATENNSIKQPPSGLKPSEGIVPGILSGFSGLEQMPVMAVTTTPGTTLTENNGCQSAGEIDRRKRRDSPHVNIDIIDRNHKSYPARQQGFQQNEHGRDVRFAFPD